MWVALLNLENSYGGEEATLSTLGRAVQHADTRRMYLAAIDVFHRSQKPALLEQCLRAVTKKFGDATDVSGGGESWGLGIVAMHHQSPSGPARPVFTFRTQSRPPASTPVIAGVAAAGPSQAGARRRRGGACRADTVAAVVAKARPRLHDHAHWASGVQNRRPR